jgi:phosphoribosylaminoimidazolecarboxamide formyltransferase / IMP cyclohydrolase
MHIQIKTALVSVYYKENLEKLANVFKQQNITAISTGGTAQFLKSHNCIVVEVEELTQFPEILGGRVKTLHPKIFGGILNRRNVAQDIEDISIHNITHIDMVVVDLYPFEETLKATEQTQEIIEKIDIGGVSLLRAAAKNFEHVLVVSSKADYEPVAQLLSQNNGTIDLESRKLYATKSFATTSHYDTAIFNYFNGQNYTGDFRLSLQHKKTLRYGENPHQQGAFFGNLNEMFTQLNGKELSYNNLLDVDAAVQLIADFDECTFAIIKHNNACGIASANNVVQAYLLALQCDPLSAFGGVLVCNQNISLECAQELNKLFFEIIIAPTYDTEALQLLKQKTNRIILQQKTSATNTFSIRSVLNGILFQDIDSHKDKAENLILKTNSQATPQEIEDLIFANKICKHSKSNTIVLAQNKILLASGVGETSRIDALKHAIEKAKHFGFSLQNAAMASDAFFPFADCVEIAHQHGIKNVIQPGGSIKDKDSIDFCNNASMSMYFTGVRHFKH